eukprot:756891-Hanusia_phi.AAC.3
MQRVILDHQLRPREDAGCAISVCSAEADDFAAPSCRSSEQERSSKRRELQNHARQVETLAALSVSQCQQVLIDGGDETREREGNKEAAGLDMLTANNQIDVKEEPKLWIHLKME